MAEVFTSAFCVSGKGCISFSELRKNYEKFKEI